MANSYQVKIAARLRPTNPGELADDGIRVEHSDKGMSAVYVNNPRDNNQVFKFPFSSCYDQNSTQKEIFEKDVQPLIDVVFSGSTVTIFAYGVTSSGKTHTMQGTGEDPGVIPRAVQAVFAQKEAMTGANVSVSVSYMEIYRDEVYDLLVQRDTAPKLPVREDRAGQVFVANLSSNPVSCYAEFDSVYTRANKQRSVGSTNLNDKSSRSHAVLTLEVKMVNTTEMKTLTGKINLVDLAGSENNKETGNDAARMAESVAINKSLSVLGQVVHALNQGQARIPYRNSKLTRILQDALGGSSVGLLICNLAPGARFRQHSLNTLNFAVHTKNVENKPVINERENRPPPKAHFAAPPPPPAQLAPLTSLPSQPPAGSSRPSLQYTRVKSGVSDRSGPSRVPRVSTIGAGGSAPYPNAHARKESGIGLIHRNLSQPSLTDKDIDDRISKAVEAEVTRRLEAIEKQRQQEEDERRAKEAAEKPTSPPPEADSQTIPAGILTPLLKKHQDLDNELRRRLQELEAKYERGGHHAEFAHGLSPISRKKTGRAYVALARDHSEKGDLQNALDLYRKAETYVPDNVKLKERIIEIEWAVKNGKEFRPSPKKPKRTKSKKKAKAMRKVKTEEDEGPAVDAASGASLYLGGESDDDDTVENLLEQELPQELLVVETGRVTRSMKTRFGGEMTNSPTKRTVDENENDGEVHTPPKKSRKGVRVKVEEEAEDWEPVSPVKSRR
ncbi:P-loop containing nucleoside triphosphate hydrolase protein [Amylostereum chailletii]|nr:P-loop containing nucleoside triphosphate hydrolase protein [Amylostereum chailletii]